MRIFLLILVLGIWSVTLYALAYNDGKNREPNAVWVLAGLFVFMALMWFILILWQAAGRNDG